MAEEKKREVKYENYDRRRKAFWGLGALKFFRFLVSFLCAQVNSIAGYPSKSMASGESLYNKNNAVYRFLSSFLFLL